MNQQYPTLFCLVSLITNSLLYANEHHHHMQMNQHTHHNTTPLGIMGGHLHSKGGFMLSYQVMNMHMDGMRTNTHDISATEVATTANTLADEPMHMGNLADGSARIMKVPSDYRIAPLEMDMQMHMFGLMYGISDNLTAMLMLNYVKKDMRMLTFKGQSGITEVGKFSGHTSGIGDTQLTFLFKPSALAKLNLHLSGGFSFPTGRIDEKGKVLPPFAGMMGTTANEKVAIDRLAYPMQLGSGSYELLLGSTYRDQQKTWSWGVQVNANLPLNKNNNHYRLGNQFSGTTWLSQQWIPSLATSARLSFETQGKIHGRDEVITGGNPLSNADNSGQDIISAQLGLNLTGHQGFFKGQQLAIEFSIPLYQKVNGLQMSQDWNLSMGWQIMF